MKREVPEGYTVRYEHQRYRDEDVTEALQNLVADPDLKPRDISLPTLRTFDEKRSTMLSPTGGITIAHVFDEAGNEVATGQSRCSILDGFNRKIARDIARGRALKSWEREA